MPRRVWLVASLLVLMRAPRDARASDANANARRVAVRVTDATSRALMQRIRGQTSDLDLALVEATEPAIEARVSDEVATADVLARQLDARIVVWFEEGPQGLTLFFSLPGERRTLVRTMTDEPSGPAPSSASFEAAALVVRSVLRALASGATIGVTLAAPLDPEPPPRPPPTPPAAKTEEKGAREAKPAEGGRSDRAARWGWGAAVGWHAALADPGAFLQGAEARAEVSPPNLRDFRGGLEVAFDASPALEDPDATVKLLRLEGGAFAAYAPALGERWRLAVGVAAGAVAFHRDTVSVAPGVTRAPSAWLASARVGPEAGVSYRARGGGLSWGLGIRLGVDVVLTPPVIGNEVAGAFVAEHALSSIEPKAVVAVEIGSP